MINVHYYGGGQLPYGINITPERVNEPIGERTFGDVALDIITWIMEAFT